jgi:hypothetical protein
MRWGRRRRCGRVRWRRRGWRSRMWWRRRRRRSRAGRWSSLRRLLRRLLGFPVRTHFLSLRNDDRCRLRVRWGGHQLHGRQCGRGKQRDSQVCHVLWILGKFLKKAVVGMVVKSSQRDEQTSVRPDCGGFLTGTRNYFQRCAVSTRRCSRSIHSRFFKSRSMSAMGARSDRQGRASAVRPACGPVIHRAVAARPARAPAAESPDSDFPADLPAVARPAVPA